MRAVDGGYKTQTITQLASILFAHESGNLSLRGMRVYLSAVASVAVREASIRSKAKSRGESRGQSRYTLKELATLTGLTLNKVKKELRALERIGLIAFKEQEILFNERPIEGSEELLEVLAGRRSTKRPIPLQRKFLRYLCKQTRGSELLVALIYCVRGLTISRTGEIKSAGSVKATWIGETLGLSERSVRAVRAKLISLNWISKDIASRQLKLNRTGSYFVINLAWEGVTATGSEVKKREVVSVPVPNFAPLPPKKESNFAPPIRNKKTSLQESKNQKSTFEGRIVAPLVVRSVNESGVCTANKKDRGGDIPRISNVRVEDLSVIGRTEVLYWDAVRQGLVTESEASAINYVAAACKARRVKRKDMASAPKVFMGIVRKKLWGYIAEEDEDRALAAIKKYREIEEDLFRFPPTAKRNFGIRI